METLDSFYTRGQDVAKLNFYEAAETFITSSPVTVGKVVFELWERYNKQTSDTENTDPSVPADVTSGMVGIYTFWYIMLIMVYIFTYVSLWVNTSMLPDKSRFMIRMIALLLIFFHPVLYFSFFLTLWAMTAMMSASRGPNILNKLKGARSKNSCG